MATTDAGINACDDLFTAGAPDGSVNACGACFDAALIPMSGRVPSKWGVAEYVEVTPGGDGGAPFVIFAGYNLGGCIMATDPGRGTQCGLDFMALDACAYQTCTPLCPIPTSEPQSAFTALDACLTAAQQGACKEYVDAANNDCAAVASGHGGGAYATCSALVAEDDYETDGGPTKSEEQTLITTICGN